MSDARDSLLDSLLVERFGPLTRLLAEKSHDEHRERRRLLDAHGHDDEEGAAHERY